MKFLMTTKNSIMKYKLVVIILVTLLIFQGCGEGNSVFDPDFELPGNRPIVTNITPDPEYLAGVDSVIVTGENFSDNDPLYAGADSVELLKRTAKLVGDKGFVLINADCTVIIDKPNISQVKSSMENVLSTAAGGLVTVCGKRTEGIGALGRGEGAVALAVALLGIK